MIHYKKMSLFDAPEGSYLVHACNSQGVWGSGIATKFKEKFPHSYAVYHRACQGNSKFALGKSWSIHDVDYTVTCLIVSEGYGMNKSSEEDILMYTEMALHSLLKYVTEWEKKTNAVYSNRFNSGFFAVPWHKTEKVLKKVLEQYSIDWVVCDPDLGESGI